MEDKDKDDARLHILVPVSPDSNGELINNMSQQDKEKKPCTPYTPFPFHNIFFRTCHCWHLCIDDTQL